MASESVQPSARMPHDALRGQVLSERSVPPSNHGCPASRRVSSRHCTSAGTLLASVSHMTECAWLPAVLPAAKLTARCASNAFSQEPRPPLASAHHSNSMVCPSKEGSHAVRRTRDLPSFYGEEYSAISLVLGRLPLGHPTRRNAGSTRSRAMWLAATPSFSRHSSLLSAVHASTALRAFAGPGGWQPEPAGDPQALGAADSTRRRLIRGPARGGPRARARGSLFPLL